MRDPIERWRSIADCIPRRMRQQGLKMAIKTIDQQKHPEARQEAIAFLQPIQQKQTQELSALLGREFPEWNTLFG